jgi:hypothetical protein
MRERRELDEMYTCNKFDHGFNTKPSSQPADAQINFPRGATTNQKARLLGALFLLNQV